MTRTALAGALLLAATTALGQAAPPAELRPIVEKVAGGELDAAEADLRRLLQAAESAAARDLLGLVLARQGRDGEAERELLRALEMSPDFFPARRNLGRLYLQQNRSEEALAQLRAAADLAPLELELTFQLARLELGHGDAAAGERHLRAMAAERDSVRALLELARSLARRGQNEEALGLLERAREIAPNSEEVLSAHARLLLAERAPVPAIATLEALRRLHPSVAIYPYLLGVAQLQIAESAAGIESLEDSLDLDPRQALAWIALGLAFNTQKRLPEAKQALNRALQLMPGNVDALVALAEAEEGLGELEAAERHVARALAIAGEAGGALYVLGKIRMAQSRYDEARDLLLRSVASDSTMSKAHYQLSLAYARLGDRESSRRQRELYRQALADEEERVIELRTAAGLGVGGMRRGG